MKLLAQPVTGGEDSNSAGPALEPGYEQQPFATLLISILPQGSRYQVIYPFCNEAAEAWGQLQV